VPSQASPAPTAPASTPISTRGRRPSGAGRALIAATAYARVDVVGAAPDRIACRPRPRLGARRRPARRHRDRQRRPHRPERPRRPLSPAAARGRNRLSGPRAAGISDATHEVKIVGLRRKIAQKMQESKRRIPHYSYVEEVDVTEVEALRR
jgi:2-oxoisovalerate dehydrogenase E2 component (dihydrolipoyl transacylase)